MEIRHTAEADLARVMDIYARARAFMAAHGNPHQWGPTNWPPESLIRADIAEQKSYVCVHDGEIVGTFFYDFGTDIEPNYRVIEDGSWIGSDTCGVLHRLAAAGTAKGVGSACIEWAYAQCRHLRVDTHTDNVVMQNLLKKHGFIHCGTIYVPEDSYPRLAYEKL